MTIDDVLKQIQSKLNLEAETEHEVLEEIRGHLEEAVMAARGRGHCPRAWLFRSDAPRARPASQRSEGARQRVGRDGDGGLVRE